MRSPSVRRVTPAPTRATRSTPSWPGMNGNVGLTGQSPFLAWMSGMAKTRGLDLHDDLTGTRLGRRNVAFDDERLTELMENCRFIVDLLS